MYFLPIRQIFGRYCDHIAKLEGPIEKMLLIKGSEDGINWFKIEQAWKLLFFYYLKFKDKELTRLGNKLILWGLIGHLAIFSLFIAAILINKVRCGV